MGLFDGIRKFLFGDPNEKIEEAAQQQIGATQQALDVQRQMQEKALAAEQEMFNKALAEAAQGRTESLAALLAGSQTQFDLGRYLAGQEITNALPRQAAGMSALQALPQLQAALGIPSFALPNTLDTTLPPQIDFMAAYQRSLGQIPKPPALAQPTAFAPPPPLPPPLPSAAPTLPPSLADVNRLPDSGGKLVLTPQNEWLGLDREMAPNSVVSLGGQSYTFQPGPDSRLGFLVPITPQGASASRAIQQFAGEAPPIPAANPVNPTGLSVTSPAGAVIPETPAAVSGPAFTPSKPSSFELKPSGVTYDVKASPLYEFQRGQAETNINRALTARGLGGGAPAAAVLGEAYSRLAAEERERQVRDMFNMVGLGMGVQPQLSPAAQALPGAAYQFGSGLSNVFGQAGQQRMGLFQQQGQNLANAYTGMGATQAQGLLNIGNIQGQVGQAMAQTPSAFGQLLQTGLSLYGAGAFGGGGSYLGFPNSTWMNTVAR